MAQVVVCSQIKTKHINTVWVERKLLSVKLLAHHVTSRLLEVNKAKNIYQLLLRRSTAWVFFCEFIAKCYSCDRPVYLQL